MIDDSLRKDLLRVWQGVASFDDKAQEQVEVWEKDVLNRIVRDIILITDRPEYYNRHRSRRQQ